MSSMSIEKSASLNATPENCFIAFKTAISALDKYSILLENNATYTIEVNKKAELMTVGYGENITFVAKSGNHITEILISVAPKGLPYLLWRTNCEKVAQTVFSAFSEAVQQYITTDPLGQFETNSIADEIRKFKELLDMGAITQQEYDAKKAELLNL